MKERPILFSGPMVRAILEHRKTQTRRVVKPRPHSATNAMADGDWWPHRGRSYNLGHKSKSFAKDVGALCPCGTPGDRLWVRETWACLDPERRTPVLYRASESPLREYVWRPSIHMPRWASRITLDVTDVRVERLQDITEEDAKAEGVEQTSDGWWRLPDEARLPGENDCASHPRAAFSALWESINGKGSWAANPWVWVISFNRIEADAKRGAA